MSVELLNHAHKMCTYHMHISYAHIKHTTHKTLTPLLPYRQVLCNPPSEMPRPTPQRDHERDSIVDLIPIIYYVVLYIDYHRHPRSDQTTHTSHRV